MLRADEVTALGANPEAGLQNLVDEQMHRELYEENQCLLFRAGNHAAGFEENKDSFSIDDYVKWVLALRTRVEPRREKQWIDKLASNRAYGFRVRSLNRVGVSTASDETMPRLVTPNIDELHASVSREDKDGATKTPSILDIATCAETPVRSLQYLRPVRPFSLDAGDAPMRVPSAQLVPVVQNLFRAIGVQNDGEACRASLRPVPLTPQATPSLFGDAWRQATGFGLLFEMLTGRVRLGLRNALDEAMAHDLDDDDDEDDDYGASRTPPPKFAAGDEVEATENSFLKDESANEANKGDRVCVMSRSFAETQFTTNQNSREETRWSDAHPAACGAIGTVQLASSEMLLLQFPHMIVPLWFPKKAVTFDLSGGTFRRAVVDAVHGDGTYRLLIDDAPVDLVPECSICTRERTTDREVDVAAKTDRKAPLVRLQRVRVLRPKVVASPAATSSGLARGGAPAADVDTVVQIMPELAIVMEVMTIVLTAQSTKSKDMVVDH